MPEIDGLTLIGKIREIDTDIKIIVISAYSDKANLLEAIKLNLIEYYIKPIKRLDLKNGLNKAISSLESKDKLKIFYLTDNCYYNVLENELVIDNIAIQLTRNEIKLLNLFIDHPNMILDSMGIFNNIWEFEKEYRIESIRTLVKKLRKKLPENCIENVYGGGYKLIRKIIK